MSIKVVLYIYYFEMLFVGYKKCIIKNFEEFAVYVDLKRHGSKVKFLKNY